MAEYWIIAPIIFGLLVLWLIWNKVLKPWCTTTVTSAKRRRKYDKLDVGGASGGDNDLDENDHLSDTDLALEDENVLNDIEMGGLHASLHDNIDDIQNKHVNYTSHELEQLKLLDMALQDSMEDDSYANNSNQTNNTNNTNNTNTNTNENDNGNVNGNGNGNNMNSNSNTVSNDNGVSNDTNTTSMDMTNRNESVNNVNSNVDSNNSNPNSNRMDKNENELAASKGKSKQKHSKQTKNKKKSKQLSEQSKERTGSLPPNPNQTQDSKSIFEESPQITDHKDDTNNKGQKVKGAKED